MNKHVEISPTKYLVLFTGKCAQDLSLHLPPGGLVEPSSKMESGLINYQCLEQFCLCEPVFMHTVSLWPVTIFHSTLPHSSAVVEGVHGGQFEGKAGIKKYRR